MSICIISYCYKLPPLNLSSLEVEPNVKIDNESLNFMTSKQVQQIHIAMFISWTVCNWMYFCIFLFINGELKRIVLGSIALIGHPYRCDWFSFYFYWFLLDRIAAEREGSVIWYQFLILFYLRIASEWIRKNEAKNRILTGQF